MNIKKFSKLGKLERMCTLCNRDLEAKDIESENYIETYKSYRYRLAHRTCYNDYLDYIKKIWRDKNESV